MGGYDQGWWQALYFSHISLAVSQVKLQECIIAHPDEARTGVSRPTIKKFVETKYHVTLDHATASQLNRAITSGSEKGTFVLPKGPSGKVKLAPKARTDAAKEVCPHIAAVVTHLSTNDILHDQNAKPVSKKSAPTKIVATKAPATKARGIRPTALKKVSVGKAPVKAKASTTTARTKRVAPKTSIAKPVKKAVTVNKTAAAKKPATTKKMTTVKKGAVKKSVTGEVKKPTKRAPAAKPKATTKPAAKAKPASKPKPAFTKKPASQKV
ncbi:hypothetical protein C0989_003694 [Termitomyces sp. Mn162]|nr:hypothetical protein C0989_003694 [Termitomyces sp. Mn162]